MNGESKELELLPIRRSSLRRVDLAVGWRGGLATSRSTTAMQGHRSLQGEEVTGLNDNFQCQCCGACCRIKDGICRVSDAEIARIAAFLGRTEEDFIANETEVAPDRRTLMLKSRPDGACAWLTEDNRCLIHPVKPDKCRTFPYEWTNPDSSSVCPGLKILAEKGSVKFHC